MLDRHDSQFAAALRKGARVLIRQSSNVQRLKHTGSADVQLEAVEVLRQLGWEEEQIEIVDARGESADFDKPRPKFNALLRDVRAGEVGIVTIGRGDRLGRNDLESSIFLEACAQTRTYILDGSKLYNPASVNDKLVLRLFSVFAEYENQARTRWLLRARFAKARKLEYRIPLPTPLVWASPDDPEYRAAMIEAGLLHWLDNLDLHKPASRIDDKVYRILPVPDSAAVRATELALAWLLETGDPAVVLERIFDATSGWPHPGKLPVVRSRVYDPRTTEVRWESGTRRRQWGRLRDWIRTPTLYGYYLFRSPRLTEITLGTEAKEFELEFDNAFPAFGSAQDLRQVEEIYSYKGKGWKRGDYAGPRRHALANLRCAEMDEHGAQCGLRLVPLYQRDGRYDYQSHGCVEKGHGTSYVHQSIDFAVFEAVADVFNPDTVRSSIESLQAESGEVLRRRKQIEREIAHLRKKAEAAGDLAMQAHLDRDAKEERHWRAKLREVRSALEVRERDHRRVRQEEERIRSLSASDLERIKELAADLPELLARARSANPDALRRLMRELVTCVRMRRVSGFAVELEIEFPAGGTLLRRVFTRSFAATQPARVWAHGRLLEGADPSTVADELNLAPPRNHRVPWDSERVETAAYIQEHAELGDELREGVHRSTAELAADLKAPRQEIVKAAFLGQLGPARWKDGDLWLCPTLHEIHHALPEVARREVAAETGWPLDDTASRADLVEETGLSRHMVMCFAELWSGTARDATGKLYARRSEVVGALERAIREELERSNPEHLRLDPAGWRPLPEVLESHAHLSRHEILRDFPVVRPGVGYLGTRSIYVWVDDTTGQDG